MLFDPAECCIWHFEISLTIVVETSQSSNMLDRVDSYAIDDHAHDECSEGNQQVV